MVKIADYTDNKYAYIYSYDEEELEEAKRIFATHIVDIGYKIRYKDTPAFIVRKSK